MDEFVYLIKKKPMKESFVITIMLGKNIRVSVLMVNLN